MPNSNRGQKNRGSFSRQILATSLLRLLTSIGVASEIGSASPVEVKSSVSGEELKTVTAFVKELALKKEGPRLVLIAPGEFTMGDGSRNLGPPRRISLTRDFFLGATELTQLQWTALMGANPSRFIGDNLPVENVSWEDAISYCEKLTQREQAAGRLPLGWRFTLPTEAQWEFACRAGTTSEYAGDIEALGWSNKNSAGGTHAVGTKPPNPWGLFDLHGSVWEWCLDFYSSYPGSGVAASDPTGPRPDVLMAATHKAGRVIRGGGWSHPPQSCKSTTRASASQGYSQGFGPNASNVGSFGFRVALVPSR